ncbi:hypothetical protein A6S26_05070 [Nostoc sp. ATCC 43529]|nr:hypothetical protein A6S26_05070 [Nostoc sp. ATCC 43529]
MAEVSLKVFCSYSHIDEPLRDELDKHLSPFIQSGIISNWHDRKILPGEEWDDEIKKNLKTADIILLLISSDFLASRYCWEVEVNTAIERHKAREACVIPIILRSVYWKYPPLTLAQIQALPKNATPVISNSWHNRDEAFTNVVEGIWNAAEKLIEARKQQLKEQEENEKLQKLAEQEETPKLELQQAEEANRQLNEADNLQRLRETIEVERQRQQETQRLQKIREQEEVERLQQEQQSASNELSSEKGVDYTRLRDLLRDGVWIEADRETLAVMLKASGSEQNTSLDLGSISKLPCTDLRTIDQLWVKYSNGRFGFSVQKRIWESVEDYDTFSDRVGWRKWRTVVVNKWFGLKQQTEKQIKWLTYSDFTFDTSAPEGHLPILVPRTFWGQEVRVISVVGLFRHMDTCEL